MNPDLLRNTNLDFSVIEAPAPVHRQSSSFCLRISSLGKFMERMANSCLDVVARGEHCALSSNKFGYCRDRSTLNPLTLLDHDIGRAFSNAAVLFGLIKAYATAGRHRILNELRALAPYKLFKRSRIKRQP